ncbi:RAC-alpha serine/threonine-protein kinase [Clydaea vesicula]|uniref:RAC-alpha serine/threonine-protein kinase n=1 Tax=Clydaea vesicula TaxID=447962 RepID=A0AAD5U980_9FUNG|nr:RAC-alpha serine/threonine-protein kinase [Clydaea vesicula]
MSTEDSTLNKNSNGYNGEKLNPNSSLLSPKLQNSNNGIKKSFSFNNLTSNAFLGKKPSSTQVDAEKQTIPNKLTDKKINGPPEFSISTDEKEFNTILPWENFIPKQSNNDSYIVQNANSNSLNLPTAQPNNRRKSFSNMMDNIKSPRSSKREEAKQSDGVSRRSSITKNFFQSRMSSSSGEEDFKTSKTNKKFPPEFSVNIIISEPKDVAHFKTNSEETKRNSSTNSFIGQEDYILPANGFSLKVSSSHQVLMKDEEEFKEAALVCLTNSEMSSVRRKHRSMAYFKARTVGSCTVHFYTVNGTCHKLEVTPNTTLHEVRLEVESTYGNVSVIEDCKIVKLEPNGTESTVNPNTPLDFYIPNDETDIEKLNNAAGILSFKLKSKPPQWNITVEVNSEKKNRFVVVSSGTTGKEVLDLLHSIEGCSDEDRERLGLYRESNRESDAKRNSRFLELDEKPFVMNEDAKYILMDYNDANKRATKLTNIFGVSSNTNINDVISQELNAAEDTKRRNEALKSTKLTHWFGFNVEEEKRTKNRSTSEINNASVTSHLLGRFKKDQQFSVDSSFSTYNSHLGSDECLKRDNQRELPPIAQSTFSLNRQKRFEGIDNNSISSNLSLNSAVASSGKERKTNKLLDYFGVKAGEKDMTVVANLSREKVGRRIQKHHSDNTFLVRVYFGNLTYTSISLPMNATAELAMNLLFKKFNIKDNVELYGIHEYVPNTGVEKEIGKSQQIFDIMIKWEQTEMFLFKRKATKKRLRAQVLGSNSKLCDKDYQIEGEEKDISVIDLSDSLDASKRATKLTNFFGVNDKASSTIQRPFKSFRGKREAEELNKIIREMQTGLEAHVDSVVNQDSEVKAQSASRGVIQVEAISKEGWLNKEEKKVWKTCWVSINSGKLSVRYTNLKRDSVSERDTKKSDSKVIVIPLEESVVEKFQTHQNVKMYTFVILDKKKEKNTFAANSEKECDEWVTAINHARESFIKKIEERIQKRRTQTNLMELPQNLIVPGSLSKHTSIVSSTLDEGLLTEEIEEPSLSLTDFQIHKVVGKGKFAKVLLCSQKTTGKVYAMKVIQKEGENETTDACNESRILHSIIHPFIVCLLCAFQSPERLYLVMEYVNGGELFFHISNFGRFSEERVKFYSAEILLGVECLHGKGIIYRDLKLENILLSKDGHIKITDFGLSKREEDKEEDSSHVVGTLEYLAPEVLKGEKATYAADWWAYGVVLFEMLCGYHPFYSEEREYIHEFILNAPIEFPEHVSDEACDLAFKLLTRNPEKRLGSGGSGGLEIRSQKYFESIDFVKLFNKEIPVPFQPELVDDFDVRFFDEQFTEEPITPVMSSENVHLME